MRPEHPLYPLPAKPRISNELRRNLIPLKEAMGLPLTEEDRKIQRTKRRSTAWRKSGKTLKEHRLDLLKKGTHDQWALTNSPKNQIRILAMEMGVDERTFDEHLKRIASEKAIQLENGEAISRMEALARATLARATREATKDAKNPNWTRFVTERMLGKPTQHIESTSTRPELSDEERERIKVLAERLALEYDKAQLEHMTTTDGEEHEVVAEQDAAGDAHVISTD